MKPQTEATHTPTPLAVAIYQSMGMYKNAFGEEMHGTHSQIAAMLELGPMKPIVRAVNNHEALLEALKQAHKLLLKNDIIMTGNDELIAKAKGK